MFGCVNFDIIHDSTANTECDALCVGNIFIVKLMIFTLEKENKREKAEKNSNDPMPLSSHDRWNIQNVFYRCADYVTTKKLVVSLLVEHFIAKYINKLCVIFIDYYRPYQRSQIGRNREMRPRIFFFSEKGER